MARPPKGTLSYEHSGGKHFVVMKGEVIDDSGCVAVMTDFDGNGEAYARKFVRRWNENATYKSLRDIIDVQHKENTKLKFKLHEPSRKVAIAKEILLLMATAGYELRVAHPVAKLLRLTDSDCNMLCVATPFSYEAIRGFFPVPLPGHLTKPE